MKTFRIIMHVTSAVLVAAFDHMCASTPGYSMAMQCVALIAVTGNIWALCGVFAELVAH